MLFREISGCLSARREDGRVENQAYEQCRSSQGAFPGLSLEAEPDREEGENDKNYRREPAAGDPKWQSIALEMQKEPQHDGHITQTQGKADIGEQLFKSARP